LPTPQSLLTVHATGLPASSPGGTQVSPLQTVPFGHCVELVHFSTQPLVVQTEPLMQSLSLVHVVAGGGVTAEQP
jgi:hypothetical protein